MEEDKRNLQGSESRDVFKRCHKQLDATFYATDADFCLVSKHPPGTVAYLDYKTPRDHVTFAEAIQYNEWAENAPVYIVESKNPRSGAFTIRRYLGADWQPDPPDVTWGDTVTTEDWDEFGEWEGGLRAEYKKRGGWRGNLRGNASKLESE